jgi:putative membrane protein
MNQNKKIIKKTGAAFLCAAMVANAGTASVMAVDNRKDENVYVNLNMDGSVSGVYVVNEYNLTEKTEITDYGNYASVKNLSSDDTITLSGDKVQVEAPAGKLYYQDNLNGTKIPWNIEITYELDGQKISADELAGKDGKLKISLSVKDNKDSDDEFFDNYLIQGTVTLDTKKCSNIQADGVTQANVGSDRQLLYSQIKQKISIHR